MDVGAWRVERGDQPTWVARLLSPSRPVNWALIHPDFVLPKRGGLDGGEVLVDWTGAGRGPRL